MAWRLLTATIAAITGVSAGLGDMRAFAADYQQPLPPPVIYQPPPPMQDGFASGWYLRGHVGVAANIKPNLVYTTQTNASLQNYSYADSTFIGGAIGYEWNSWLRFDVSAEYRSKSRVYALVTYPPGGIDEYQGYIKSLIFMANAFVDLGTWECFTPFVGLGVGFARNSLTDFTDVNPNGGFGAGRNPTETKFAYALHAGVAYNVTKNFKVDLSYRYMDYGSISDTVDCNVVCTQDTFKFDKLRSHDIMLGLRWTCCEVTSTDRYVYQAPAPVYTQPQVYQPPQVYAPPPPQPVLRSRG